MYAMTGNLADAQDLVQEAYARAWQRWSSVSTYADPEAWVGTVAWRLASSRWRKTKNGVAAMLRHGPPSHAPEPSIDNVALVTALRQIPEASGERSCCTTSWTIAARCAHTASPASARR
jgi:RNA polymerase sigma-70 factor, ECF subfamily